MRLVDCYSELFAYVLALVQSRSEEISYETAKGQVEGLLRKSASLAGKKGAPEAEYDSSRFAVCAWVDEMILCSGWGDKEQWRNHQLQRVFYATNNAGVEFFHRLEELHEESHSVREVYAACLALGFHGRYFHDDELLELKKIREANLKTLPLTPMMESFSTSEKLFAAAYQGGDGLRKLKGSFRPFDWTALLIFIVSVIITIELYMYYRNSLDIDILRFFGALQ